MVIHKRTRLTEMQRRDIWDQYGKWVSVSSLALSYHVSRVTLYKVLKRARKREFVPRNSENHKYRTLEWWLKRLSKVEEKILKKKNSEAKRYNKQYPGEILHMDTKRLPTIKDDTDRTPEYLFVWIDDYSRELYISIHPDKSQESSSRFLEQIMDECPYKIEKIYTDNGKEYKGSERHLFVQTCEKYSITQAFTKVRRPTNQWKSRTSYTNSYGDVAWEEYLPNTKRTQYLTKTIL